MQKRVAFKDYLMAAFLYLVVNVCVFHSDLYKYFCEPTSYAGNVYGRMDILAGVEADSQQKPVLLLGDSITEEGIDPNLLSERIGRPVVNLALPGTSPLDWYHFLRSVDPHQDRFDRIVMTVVPQTVRTQAHDDGIQTLLPVASPGAMLQYLSTRRTRAGNREDYYAAFDRIFAFRRDLRQLVLTPSRWSRVGTARNERLHWLRDYRGQAYDVCKVRVENSRVIRWGNIQDEEVRRLIRHNVNRINRLNYKPEITGILDPLRKIVEAYSSSETRLIIVSVPFGPGHRVSGTSPPIARYLSEISTFVQSGQVSHWAAFDEPFYHQCSNFFDFRHLNHRGRLLFSEWLAKRLKGSPANAV